MIEAQAEPPTEVDLEPALEALPKLSLEMRLDQLEKAFLEIVKLTLFLLKTSGYKVSFVTPEEAAFSSLTGKAPTSNN